MDFAQLIESIFGSDWLSNITNLVSSVVAIVVTIVINTLKNKISNKDSLLGQSIDVLSNKMSSLIEQNSELKKRNEQSEAEIEILKSGIASIGDIVATSFLDSKAISADAKIKIGATVNKLAELGIDISAANAVTKPIEQVTESVAEVVQIIKEEAKEIAEEKVIKAEETQQKSLDIYNEILDNE